MAMTDAQREILQKNHTFLLDNMSNVVEVCDVLYRDGILSRENSDKINVSRFQSCIIRDHEATSDLFPVLVHTFFLLFFFFYFTFLHAFC